MELQIFLHRPNQIYNVGETIRGYVDVVAPEAQDISHQGLTLALVGVIQPEQSNKNVGHFEAFYNSLRSRKFLSINRELLPPGKCSFSRKSTNADGNSVFSLQVPFELRLPETLDQPMTKEHIEREPMEFLESYHGVYIRISYILEAKLLRRKHDNAFFSFGSYLHAETITEVHLLQAKPKKDTSKAVTRPFFKNMTPSDCKLSSNNSNKGTSSSIPDFKIDVRLNSTSCLIAAPFQGEFLVKECSVPIKSVELQLVRVETCGVAEGYATERTEVQNVQIAAGDVKRSENRAIPLHMMFPRMFVCPTVQDADIFRIEFEVNFVVVFETNKAIVYPIPITLHRF